jgi:5-methylcytosine-specific restriction enzyme subunit McrC
MLLYPKHLVDLDDNLTLGKDENIVNLRLKSIDLNFDGEFSEYIEKIKERIENGQKL